MGPSTLCCAIADAGCTEIRASNYGQSCATDSDCVVVIVGDPCQVCIFGCGLSGVDAINVCAMPQYQADVGKTPTSIARCNCPLSDEMAAPCCRSGKCYADSTCL